MRMIGLQDRNIARVPPEKRGDPTKTGYGLTYSITRELKRDPDSTLRPDIPINGHGRA
jgi:hypothetical protein